ncbi:PREDICTED: pentatricopeptide repeat-containing protein At2g06000 isoform X1 [Camelina sativa]|uniref:Pentatricopeptide repeat-containing protein At2g06000 isoform X1 n=1 Tax=Camelina sativa TaxID=90675 RepID=A0ABM0XP41_CAMSA|nr:PREDICTED: pentatricopeptide repeat-containing protein At2g06000 isoform X1 [Camelina sativa]
MIRTTFATAIAHFHTHSHGGAQARPLQSNNKREVMHCPEAWLVKIVSTLFVYRVPDSDLCFCYLSKNLNPFIAFEVVKKLDNNNPHLGFRFWEFSRFKLNIRHSFWTYNLLTRSLCKAGMHDLAGQMFESMKSDGVSPNSRLLGFLVASFAEKGKLHFATALLLQSYEVEGCFMVVNSLLNTLVKLDRVEDAMKLFDKHLRFQSCNDTKTFNILIRGLCCVGKAEKALELLGEMRSSFGCSPDIVTYNTLIKGFCKSNELARANEMLNDVKSSSGCSPDVVTYTSMISGYCKAGKMQEASRLLDDMLHFGIYPTTITFNVLVDGYAKAGEMPCAEDIRGKMISFGCFPDVVTFTSLIDGYCRVGQVNQGFRLWEEMNAKGMFPNEYTYSILINALCKENSLLKARELLGQLASKDVITKPFMYNPVIDGFCKAGKVNEANVIVEEMEKKKCKPDKITFTILIIGHCMKGRMFEAVSIFHKMVAIGCSPDKITVNSLLSCLLKAGMAKEAYLLNQIVRKGQSNNVAPLETKTANATLAAC